LGKKGISFTCFVNFTLCKSSMLQGNYFILIESMLGTYRKAILHPKNCLLLDIKAFFILSTIFGLTHYVMQYAGPYMSSVRWGFLQTTTAGMRTGRQISLLWGRCSEHWVSWLLTIFLHSLIASFFSLLKNQISGEFSIFKSMSNVRGTQNVPTTEEFL